MGGGRHVRLVGKERLIYVNQCSNTATITTHPSLTRHPPSLPANALHSKFLERRSRSRGSSDSCGSRTNAVRNRLGRDYGTNTHPAGNRKKERDRERATKTRLCRRARASRCPPYVDVLPRTATSRSYSPSRTGLARSQHASSISGPLLVVPPVRPSPLCSGFAATDKTHAET